MGKEREENALLYTETNTALQTNCAHKTGLEGWHLGGEVEEEREAEAQGVLVPPVCWFLSLPPGLPRLVILQEPDSDGLGRSKRMIDYSHQTHRAWFLNHSFRESGQRERERYVPGVRRAREGPWSWEVESRFTRWVGADARDSGGMLLEPVMWGPSSLACFLE